MTLDEVIADLQDLRARLGGGDVPVLGEYNSGRGSAFAIRCVSEATVAAEDAEDCGLPEGSTIIYLSHK